MKQLKQANLRLFLILGFLGIVLSICAAVFFVINNQGKEAVVAETNETIEQTGNNVVHELDKLLNRTAALTKATATLAQTLPLNEKTFVNSIYQLNNNQKFTSLEGFGIWLEPFAFQDNKTLDSVDWVRNQQGNFVRNPDHDAQSHKKPFWQEAWYVIGQYTNTQRCAWTDPYIDSINNVSIVTCSTGIYRDNKLFGVAKMNIGLSRINNEVRAWQEKTGGYAFLTGADNHFIAFPDAEKKLDVFLNVQQKKRANHETASVSLDEIASIEPSYEPILKIFRKLDVEIISKASKTNADFDKNVVALTRDSADLDAVSATLRTSILADVFANDKRFERSKLYAIVPIKNDALLGTDAAAYIFYVPNTYWKYVVVKPQSEITNNADLLVKNLLLYLLPLVFITGLLTYILANRMVFSPLLKMAQKMETVTTLLADKNYSELKKHRTEINRKDELGLLNDNINQLLEKVEENEKQLATVNQSLEQQVTERTQDLKTALEQLKSSQAQLVNSEKMAALGQMVAGVAHEVNTPLSYIKNNVTMTQQYLNEFDELINKGNALYTLLQTDTPASQLLADADIDQFIKEVSHLSNMLHTEESSADASLMLDDALYGINQIADMVANLKNFARVDEAKVKSTNLNDCVRTALNIAKGNLSCVHIEKTLKDLPEVMCSPSQINQVLLNLFNNAAQAMQSGGTLHIKTYVDNEFACIDVIDTGTGMSADMLEKIFEPFFTTKAAGEGTGLGLAISHQILTQHHGQLLVNSDIGKGTTFTIKLLIDNTLSNLITTESML